MARIHHRHRARLLKRDRHKCFFCDTRNDLDIHHIKPQCKGGTSDDENCVTACSFCHKMLKRSIEGMLIKRFQYANVKTFAEYWAKLDAINKDRPFKTVPAGKWLSNG